MVGGGKAVGVAIGVGASVGVGVGVGVGVLLAVVRPMPEGGALDREASRGAGRTDGIGRTFFLDILCRLSVRTQKTNAPGTGPLSEKVSAPAGNCNRLQSLMGFFFFGS